jgi:hypothetical protein
MSSPLQEAFRAGYSEDEIVQRLKTNPEYSDKVSKALDAGYTPNEIYERIAYKDSKNPNQYQIDKIESDYLKKHGKPREKGEGLNTKAAQFLPEEEAAELPEVNKEFITGLGKGAISGASLGLSEGIGLEHTEGEQAGFERGQVIGSFLPYSKLINTFTGPLIKLAGKSPVFTRQLGSLAEILGVGAAGATGRAAEKAFQGEMPSAEDLLEHGAAWAALDAGLKAIGGSAVLADRLLFASAKQGKPSFEVLNGIMNELRASGEDFTVPERVAAKAMSILEQEPLEAVGQGFKAKPHVGNAEEIAALEAAKPVEAGLRPTLGRQLPPGAPGAGGLAAGEAKPGVAFEGFIPKVEPISPTDLRTRKISPDTIQRVNKEAVALSEPYAPDIDFTAEAESLAKTGVEDRIDQYATRAFTEEELGTGIKQDIEQGLKKEKAEYKPFYDQAKDKAKQIFVAPIELGNKILDKLQHVSRLETKPPGYDQVIKTLERSLKDLGYSIEKDAAGEIVNIVSAKDVSVEQMMELGIRLNEIIDFQALEPTVQNVLKGIVKDVKAEIRAGLAEVPDALAAFELAEKEHARVAKKYGSDAIRRIRTTEAGEKIAAQIMNPTTLQNLKATLTPAQYQQVEREILEKLQEGNLKQGRKQLREIKKYLSKDAQQIAEDIVESKNPHNLAAKRRIEKEGVVNELSSSFTNGTRPSKTLNLWKSEKGQKLVREAFKDSPNWKQVENYLENQSFNDMVESIQTKDGHIDLKKLDNFMRDKATVNNIRAQGGEEAVLFFKDLSNRAEVLEYQKDLISNLPEKSSTKKGHDIIKQAYEYNTEKLREVKATNERIAKRFEAEKKQKITKLKEEDKATTKLFKEKREQDLNRREETTLEEGKKTLKRMADKDYPENAKIEAWKKFILDNLGLNSKALLSIFASKKVAAAAIGAHFLGVPTTVGVHLGFKILNKLLTSPNARQLFRRATMSRKNPIAFILAMEELDDELSH